MGRVVVNVTYCCWSSWNCAECLAISTNLINTNSSPQHIVPSACFGYVTII
jgi:hypothetical protein